MVSNSKNKLHQTMYEDFFSALYVATGVQRLPSLSNLGCSISIYSASGIQNVNLVTFVKNRICNLFHFYPQSVANSFCFV